VSQGSLPTVQNNPKLNEVMIFDKPKGGIIKKWNHLYKTASELRKKKFQSAFVLHRSFTSAFIAWMAGIPERIGLDTQGRGFLLTVAIPLDENLHRLDNNLRILAAADEKIQTNRPEYFPGNDIGSIVEEVKKFKGEKKLVVINPNGVWETKRWQVRKFAKLVEMLTNEIGAKVVIIGSQGDEERGAQVSSGNENALDVTNRTSVDDLYRIMKMSDLVITNDSGPMHIAACANAKIISIFGPTDPRRCGPRCESPIILTGEAGCLGCYKKECNDLICMKTLSIERVFEEAREILKGL